MRVLALSAAVAAAVLVSACGVNLSGGGGGDAATAPASADAAKLPVDGDVRGEITSSSALNYSDGSRYQRFSMTLEKDQAVSLTLEGALPGTLAVFAGDRLVARGNGDTLVLRAESAGDYVVAVSGNAATAFGPFTLRAKAIEAYDGKPIAGEGDVLDWLTGQAQDYTLQVEHTGLYTITLSSAAFDTVLRVRGPGVEAENDDYGVGTDSQLRLYLEPGTYTLNAASLGGAGDNNGEFTLGVRYAALPGGMITRDGTELVSGQAAVGRVEGRSGRRFFFDVPADALVTIDARSDEVDTVLYIDGPSGSFEDDDGGSGTNSHMSRRLEAGRYNARVESLGGNAGVFDIAVHVEGATATTDAIEAP